MNLNYGEIVEIYSQDGMKTARIRVGKAMQKVTLELLTDANCGDTVLVCDGVAISKVKEVPDGRSDECA